MDANYCWIRANGMMAELSINQTIQYANGTSFWSALDLVIDETGIVPEFPSFLILPLFMMATLLAVVVYKKRSHNFNNAAFWLNVSLYSRILCFRKHY